jgi:DNA adenine methylase
MSQRPTAGPFLRWAGSKRQLIHALKQYYPANSLRYVEPFAGSARLFFALRPSRAILGDINAELMHMYLEVKYRARGVAALLQGAQRSKRTYMLLRRQVPENLDRASRAARFIYLNRYCFNGLYRTNTEGTFNVPFGADATGVLPPADLLVRSPVTLRGH